MTNNTTDGKLDLIIKELRTQQKLIGKMNEELNGTQKDVKSLSREFKYQREDIKSLRKEMYGQFDSWDKKFFEFKSHIHDLIDSGFSSKAKAHDEEIEVLNLRTTEIRSDIDRLNNVVFA